jgi:uncharacterized membrane protein YhaH (DUF805 family)
MAQRSLVGNLINGLTSLEGRMTRTDFWVATIALAVAAALLSLGLNGLAKVATDGGWPRWILPVILQLIIVWPTFAVMVKRGHDRERSAWWTLAVNLAGHVVPRVLLINGKTEGAFWVWAVIGAYILVDYGILDGTRGPNKYGPSPKGIGQANIAA